MSGDPRPEFQWGQFFDDENDGSIMFSINFGQPGVGIEYASILNHRSVLKQPFQSFKHAQLLKSRTHR